MTRTVMGAGPTGAALGVSGTMSLFGPVQPLIGGASVALLGATLVWRLRDRARRCDRCAV